MTCYSVHVVYRKTKRLAGGTQRQYPHDHDRFVRDGKPVDRNTRQKNRRTAEEREAAHRARLTRGEAGLPTGRMATRAKFAPVFTNWVEAECAAQLKTIAFYAGCSRRRLEFAALANGRRRPTGEHRKRIRSKTCARSSAG